MLQHDIINIVKDFLPLFVYLFLTNSLDFGDFRQIILYFGLSTWTHIEYKKTAKNVFKWYLFQISWFHIFLPFGLSFFWSRLWSSIFSSISFVYLISHLFLWWLSFSLHWLLQFHIKTFLSSFIAKCFCVFFQAFTLVSSEWSFCFFIPATTANDLRLWRIFYTRFYPLHFLNSSERASISLFNVEC